MAILIEPDVKELYYRKKMIENKRTMSFSEPVSFPEEEWQLFYDQHVHTDPKQEYYGYIFCDGCMDFVGSVEYRYDEEAGGIVGFVLIDASHRLDGYGTEGVRLLKLKAEENGYREVYAWLPKQDERIHFAMKTGFEPVKTLNGNTLLVSRW